MISGEEREGEREREERQEEGGRKGGREGEGGGEAGGRRERWRGGGRGRRRRGRRKEGEMEKETGFTVRGEHKTNQAASREDNVVKHAYHMNHLHPNIAHTFVWTRNM